jgi:peptide chain release factor subunit 1
MRLQISDHAPFVEWMAEHYKEFGAKLEFVTDRSSEGAQFVRGFGGVGGILRWKVDFVEMDEYMEADDDEFI